MNDQIKHRASFPPPTFASRVIRAGMLIKSLGLRFVWDERKGEFVMSEQDCEVMKLWEQEHGRV